MRALIYEGGLSFRTDVPVPERPAGEARIRVRMAGICNTDLEVLRGYMGFSGILGHEFVGDVVEADDPLWIGKRVAGEINCPCRRCALCRKGLERHCPQRTVLGIVNRGGAFAEFLTLPEANLHVIPDAVSDEQGVFVEPLAAAFEILEQVKVSPSERVAVLGCGKLGLLAAQVLALAGCDLLVVCRHEQGLSRCRAVGLRTALLEEMEKGSMDVVIEATGNPDGFEAARTMLRPRGTLVLKSTVAEKSCLHLAGLVVDEITVVGSRCGPFPPALRALEAGRVRLQGLIEQIVPFGRALQAFERAGRPGALKVLLDMRGGH
ncbi:MAG: alcohol dehydrogenase catalytic domain-containing protein [bacterium]